MIPKITGFLMLFLFISYYAISDESPKNKDSKKNGIHEIKKTLSNAQKTNDYCRVCCTAAITNSDGETADATRCAGWFLTGCEAASVKACAKALEAVVSL